MITYSSLISVMEVIVVIIPVLLIVAFVTISERKTMASMQRRLGPNWVGYLGSLQAFADALKLILKEYVSPAQANIILFFIGPVITLIFALLGYLVVPFGPSLALGDSDLGILYMIAVSSLSTYGILLAGWSANSKFAFLGSLRSTAQLIGYELVITSGILIPTMLAGSFNITVIIEAQKDMWFIIPLFPLFLVLFIGSVAETNRAPFDLAEAESELVSGFMTEHSAVVFVFFFLAEYASIVLICIHITILFLGGYLFNIDLFYSFLFYTIKFIYYIIDFLCICINTTTNIIMYIIYVIFLYFNVVIIYNIFYYIYHYLQDLIKDVFYILFYRPDIEITLNSRFEELIYSSFNPLDLIDSSIETLDYSSTGLYYAICFAVKTCLMIFIFIWVRASFPRVRYDQLMTFCWTILLPTVIGYMVLVPCILYNFEIIPVNINF